MWAEAILLREDLDRVIAQFVPMTVALGAGRLDVSDPAPCVLVPDTGLRIVFKAVLHWPVMGLELPVKARALGLLLRPEVRGRGEAQVLDFKPQLESIDLAAVPSALAPKIVEMMNRELVRNEVGLCWCFAKSLTHAFRLPVSMEPLDALRLEVLAGKLRILADSIGLAVQFGSAVTRHPGAAPAAQR